MDAFEPRVLRAGEEVFGQDMQVYELLFVRSGEIKIGIEDFYTSEQGPETTKWISVVTPGSCVGAEMVFNTHSLFKCRVSDKRVQCFSIRKVNWMRLSRQLTTNSDPHLGHAFVSFKTNLLTNLKRAIYFPFLRYKLTMTETTARPTQLQRLTGQVYLKVITMQQSLAKEKEDGCRKSEDVDLVQMIKGLIDKVEGQERTVQRLTQT